MITTIYLLRLDSTLLIKEKTLIWLLYFDSAILGIATGILLHLMKGVI